MADNTILHSNICKELNDLYSRKNADYGDSFHNSVKHFGLIAGLVRISDKYERLCSLIVNGDDQKVKDESIRDTFIDLANYAIMCAMEMDGGMS